jgi:hypothetical protein
MEINRIGRDIISRPACPFCGMPINKPEELHNSMPHEMPLSACECGAVYACDETGHNIGTAMIDALLFACNGDWNLAWDLLPEDDYLTAQVERYDYPSHLTVKSGAYEGRNVTGVLYFIRLHSDILEVTEEGFRQKLGKKPGAPNKRAKTGYKKGYLTKDEVERLVSEYDIKGIIDAATKDKKIIPYIQRLLYSADDLIRSRAAEAMGKATAVIAEHDPGAVKKLIKNLFIAITDTAASSWGAIETIGQIISRTPGLYASYAPQLYPFMSDKALLPNVLRALTLITAATPEPFNKIRFSLIRLLKEKEAEILAPAVMIIGNLRVKEALSDIMILKSDMREVSIYEGGHFKKMTLDEIVGSVIIKINTPK